MMKGLLICFMMLFLSPAMAQSDALAKAAEKEGLERAEDGAFRETYVNGTVDFKRFDKLMLGPAVFDYRDVGPARPYRGLSRQSSNRTVFGISEEDRKGFENIVGEAFRDQVAQGDHYTVTDAVDEKTMMVRGALVDIISRVPPRTVGQTDVYLSSVGEATLALELLDATTGEVLAVVAERGVIGANRGSGTLDQYALKSTPGSVRQAVRLWASGAGKRLREGLDEALSR